MAVIDLSSFNLCCTQQTIVFWWQTTLFATKRITSTVPLTPGFHPEKENSQIFSASLEVISLFVGAAFARFWT
ncbi:MAG: hypothetical protein Q8K12_17000 [Thiobacillus sp.]|nr:hypothetical protein [Thiobacillus sp.]